MMTPTLSRNTGSKSNSRGKDLKAGMVGDEFEVPLGHQGRDVQ